MDKIIWVDIETTGLDYEKDSILEVAVVVTDYDFVALDSFHKVVKPPVGYDINPWAKTTHTENYLLNEIDDAKGIEEIDQLAYDWANEKIVAKYKYPMAGNSIYFDKRFLESRMPLFSQFVGKNVIDVSGIAKVLDNCGLVDKDQVVKTYSHRAMRDILESIDELRYYIHKIR
jgi:oligoribonuclease